MKNKTLSIATLLLTGALLFAGCGQTGNTTAVAISTMPSTSSVKRKPAEDIIIRLPESGLSAYIHRTATNDHAAAVHGITGPGRG